MQVYNELEGTNHIITQLHNLEVQVYHIKDFWEIKSQNRMINDQWLGMSNVMVFYAACFEE
jgi:hypothetical protein